VFYKLRRVIMPFFKNLKDEICQVLDSEIQLVKSAGWKELSQDEEVLYRQTLAATHELTSAASSEAARVKAGLYDLVHSLAGADNSVPTTPEVPVAPSDTTVPTNTGAGSEVPSVETPNAADGSVPAAKNTPEVPSAPVEDAPSTPAADAPAATDNQEVPSTDTSAPANNEATDASAEVPAGEAEQAQPAQDGADTPAADTTVPSNVATEGNEQNANQ
jgi:hypothetical protein